MTKENISQEFRLKNIKPRTYVVKYIDQNELMINKNKKIFMTLNYSENFLTLVFVITGFMSFSAFASLVDISTEIRSSTIGCNICTKLQELKGLSQYFRTIKRNLIK